MRRSTATGAQAIIAVVVAVLVCATAAGAVSINVGSVTGTPGNVVTFQVSLAAGGAQVGGIQNTIAFDPATPISSCALNPALASLSRWNLQPQGCTPLVDCTHANFVIVTFGSAIPDGVLYQCEVKIAANAAGGLFPLPCSGSRVSDPAGQVLAVLCADGQVQVVPPTPTIVPTPTLPPTAASSGGGGGCQTTSGNGGNSGGCWLTLGIMLLWRLAARRGS